MNEFLTAEELADLTGRKKKSGQIDWLNQHGWIYEPNAAGWPVVSRIYMRCKMSGVKFQPDASKTFQVDESIFA